MDKKIAIVGAGAGAMSVAIQMELERLRQQGIQVVTIDQAKEQGLIPIGSSFQQRHEHLLVTPEVLTVQETDQLPLSRRERRKQERKNRKHP